MGLGCLGCSRKFVCSHKSHQALCARNVYFIYSCILTHTIGVRADEGATRVSVAGGVTSAAGTDHVLGDVAWGGKKMRCSTNKDVFFYLRKLTRSRRQSGQESGSTEGDWAGTDLKRFES